MKKYIGITLLSLILISCGKKEVTENESSIPQIINYQEINTTTENINNIFSAQIVSKVEPNVGFRVNGTIEKKNVFLGDIVKKGEILAVLDDSEYKVAYKKSLANEEKAKANLINAKSNYKRVKELYFDDNVSKADFDNATARLDSTRSAYEAAIQQTNYDKIQLGYTNLKAPVDGSITKEIKDVGENVKPGEAIYNLAASEGLEIDFFVPESIINSVNVGDLIDVRIDALGKEKLQAKITKVGTTSNGYGNTYPIKAEFSKRPTGIKPGMSAKVNILLISKTVNMIYIPVESVLTDIKGNHYVFVLTNINDKTGTITKRSVATGVINNNGIQILEGLKNGDIVITAGMSKAIDGGKAILTDKGE